MSHLTAEAREACKRRFVEGVRETGAIGKAALLAGVAPQTLLIWRKDDEEFEKAVVEARFAWEDQKGEEVESEALRRALEGDRVPVIQHGRPVYQMELDIEAFEESGGRERKLRYKLDENNELIPLYETKRDPLLMKRAIDRFCGWDEEQDRGSMDKTVSLVDDDGKTMDYREMLMEALGARPAEPRVVDMEAGGSDADDHNDRTGDSPRLTGGGEGS